MQIHLIFDLISYTVGAFLVLKVFKTKKQTIKSENTRYIYYSVVLLGSFFGAFLFGSLNAIYSIETNSRVIGKSILGAIVGGVVFVEIFKKIFKLNKSTGAYFVPSLTIGIVIGRLGCFFAGLEDYTYGIETKLSIGVDFGDGINRHPVQLYESFTMFVFFIYILHNYLTNRAEFERSIFYKFIFVYALQRFFWEFLKPYKDIFASLNIFQIICLLLVVYSIYFLKKVK